MTSGAMPRVSGAQARRFLVRRHLLAPPRALPAARESVLEVVRALGSLQFDPLEVPGARNHDLVLHARIRGYARAWCDAYLYAPAGERRLFEAYNKSLNILPIDDLPYYRAAWERAEERYRERVFARRAKTVAAVVARLEREGPLPTTAVTREHGRAVDWHWAPAPEGRAVLEALFECGRVALARREGNKRYYDLSSRLFPARLLAHRPSAEACARHRLLSRFRAVGLLGASASPEVVVGTGTAAERAAMIARLVGEGALVRVEVEGVRGPRHVLAEELAALHAAADAQGDGGAPGVAFLAPLDPILWDRKLVASLFGFDYLWEVYTPVAKRVWGYYVLPMLFGERLVGRIEPRVDRARGVLEVVGVWFQPGFDPLGAPGFVPAFAAALEDYRRFVGATRVSWPRARAARELARAVARVA